MMSFNEIQRAFSMSSQDFTVNLEKVPVTKTQLGKLFGNSLPCNLFATVAAPAMQAAGITADLLAYDVVEAVHRRH